MKIAVILITTVIVIAESAVPSAPRSEKKSNCNAPIAFTAVRSREEKGTTGRNQVFTFANILFDKNSGYNVGTGIFTTQCSGLYQFSFSASGPETRFSLKKRPSASSSSWTTLATTGRSGGSHLVFLDLQFGEQVAVFHESGSLDNTAPYSFSGLLISNK